MYKFFTYSLNLILLLLVTNNLRAQVNARLFQQPDVSQTHIAFVYAGDVWTVPKTGGTATRLSSPSGIESFPKFSPDGKEIAFSANYQGNTDVYVIPTSGGLPTRLTYHSFPDRMVNWHSNGEQVLFASSRESGKQRFSQFYMISSKGGMAEKLSVPYGEFGDLSEDGSQIVYTQKSRAFRTWKRYRGGTAPDITLFNLEDFSSELLIDSDANDEMPMWKGDKVYFLSDRGEAQRANIWSYDMKDKSVKQLTSFSDYDVHFPSIGPDEIVYEAGGKLYLLDLNSEQSSEVEINLITDQITVQPKIVDASKNIANGWISPDGKRALIEARGELFSVPAEHGFVQNITQTSGTAERYPAWSPDGKYAAYWSDKSGEYELHLYNFETSKEEQLTQYGAGFRYQLFWSPDSKKLAFVDKAMKIKFYEIENKRTIDVDQGIRMMEGALRNFKVSWSADSKWLAYSRMLDSGNSAIFIFDAKNYIKEQATTGFYSVTNPAFDPDGKYLYVTTNRTFRPTYSDFDNSFIYPNATNIAAISLRTDVKSPLSPRNDEVEIEEEKEESSEEDTKKSKKKKKKDDKKQEDDSEEEADLEIDFDGFESRMVLLPAKAGNYNNLQAVDNKIVYQKYPNTGSGDNNGSSVMYFDLKEREEKTIVKGVSDYLISANGEKMIVSKGSSLYIIEVKADQKLEDKLRTSEMKMTVNPREEWKQIFRDAWRLERDYFYDEGMHGVDWDAMYKRYGALIEDASTRFDVNFILGELIGELNASHTYRGGGDQQNEKKINVGYLGVDYGIKEGKYFIKKIIRGAEWNIKTKSPLDMPGIEVQEGDYLLAVNGIPVDVTKEPYFAFQGLGNTTVELTVNTPANHGRRQKKFW